MLPIDAELAAVLQQTHTVEYRASAFSGGQQTLKSVPLTDGGSLRFNGDQNVQCTGTVYLAKDGESLVPRSKADPLAPYGQEIRIDRVDRTGSKEWVTPLGQLRIQQVPSLRERSKNYPMGSQLIGWSAELKLQDRFDIIVGDEFLYPDSPRTPTAWSEIQRLSPVPIVQNLPDVGIPGSLTAYPDSRMEAITSLFSLLGAYPHMTRLGVLTGRLKDAWLTSTVPVFTVHGVIDMDDSLSNDLFNSVKVSSSAGNNDAFAIEEITDPGDRLNVYGPFGRRVYRQSSPLYNSDAALRAAARTILSRVSTRQSKTVTVTCLPQPHLELGDFIRAQQVDERGVVVREVDGEIAGIDVPLKRSASWTYTLIVAEIR